MADSPITKKLQEMLNEEKWTRAALSGYTVSQIKELDNLFHDAAREKELVEIKQLCDEHLGHSKNSIAALYISGIISLAQQQIDDSNMIALIEIFTDNRKWNIVEYICNRILDYGENRHALQHLAECYESEDRTEDMYSVWERLVRVDHEEADIVKLIAEKKEKEGDAEAAIDYYRKALHRFVGKKLFSNIKEIWNKLIELAPGDIDFFLHVQRKIAKQISEEKAAGLLTDLYKHYKNQQEWDTAIQLLKTIIDYDDKTPQLRKEIIECYKAKFADHSHVDEYIRVSNLGQSYRNIHEAIADFEKHISFDAGNFVYHRTWNIGRIKEIKGDDITIDFAKKRDHHMSLKMAVESLITLKKDHIWVLKAIWSKDKLHEKIKTNIGWALKTVITSFDNTADIKKIKAELVPSILSPSEWTSWSTKARTALKDDPIFGNDANSVTTFIVRDRPLSYDEKIYNQFKAEKNFFSRVQNIRDFLEKCEIDSEFFNEMLSFFVSYVKSYSQANEFVIASHLLLVEIASTYPRLKNIVTTSFIDLYNDCPDIVGVYENMKDSTLKTALLKNIKNFALNWPEIYIKIFPWSLTRSMIDILLDTGETERLSAMVQNAVDNYRDNRELFIWIVKNLWDEVWVKDLNLPYDKILIILIHILDITFKEIENHRDTTENKKLNKQVETLLFKDKRLDDYLLDADKDTTERIYALICDVKDIDASIKLNLRKKIVEKYPEFRFNDEEKSIASRGLMVTASKYEEKTVMLKSIMEVDVPANQKEIAYALSLGDLRENAEYKAAKEKQDELNAKVGKLKNEIERAQIFDRGNISTSKISFGTEVLLENLLDKSEETYIILGPWESDPTNHIISYLSPLGKRLLNHKVGDKIEFSLHERKFNYKVKKIKSADFQ
ncbi:MAG: transcription elongation factor GreA [Spirochaetes bacterium]|nr:transcription elongation factor GreA [Spirochaetota bacterium]MBU0953799.1 transcription elongation factor GreA [Spirochaetota bacterium]